MTPEERFDRLDDFIARNAVIRGAWTAGVAACLLGALSPEAAAANNMLACPSDTIAPWFACMVVGFNDRGTVEAHPAMIRRFSAIVRRCVVLTAEDWRRANYAVRAVVLRDALPHASAGGAATVTTATAAVQAVIDLCDQAAGGAYVHAASWMAARNALHPYGYHRGMVGTGLVACVARVAIAASLPDIAASGNAAIYAADAAHAAASALGGEGAGHDARCAAWDRIAAATFDVLDAACAAREAQQAPSQDRSS